MRKSIAGRLIDRLYEQVVCDPETYCLVFRGRWTAQGYAYFTVSAGVYSRLHRVSYELHVGPIPVGAVLHHVCHNKLCCNPSHLVLTTRERHYPDHHPERHRDVCPHGHALTDDNLVPCRLKHGGRVCLTCQRAAGRAQYYKNKDKWRERQRACDARLTPDERRARSRIYTARWKAKKRAQGQA